MKFRKGNVIIESDIENNFNLYKRYGFEPVKEIVEVQKIEIPEVETADTLEELKAKAKELGIRNAHAMKEETLILKIGEAQKGA